jgi:hypothetical protein
MAGSRPSARSRVVRVLRSITMGSIEFDRGKSAIAVPSRDKIPLQARPPVFRCTVVTMCPSLPLAILPGVVAELGRVS